jgi:hypothetical protein
MSEPPVTAECVRCRRNGREVYSYIGELFEFDVDAARELIRDGREPVELEPESVAYSVHTSDIDEQHVAHVDPAIPGLIAHLEVVAEWGEVVKAHRLIDGHHRAARCLREARPFFAYLLTEDESRAVLLRRPAGPLAGTPVSAADTAK